MRLPGPPVRMLFNNLPQAGVIRTLQMDRVFGQIAMGVSTHMGRYANNGGFWSMQRSGDGAIDAMIARRVESPCYLIIRIGQNCPETP